MTEYKALDDFVTAISRARSDGMSKREIQEELRRIDTRLSQTFQTLLARIDDYPQYLDLYDNLVKFLGLVAERQYFARL